MIFLVLPKLELSSFLYLIFSGDFVTTHGLQLGDFIMIYQDNQNQNYVRTAATIYGFRPYVKEFYFFLVFDKS